MQIVKEDYLINYSEENKHYIDYLTSILDANIYDIKSLFGITKLLTPITINLWDNKENMELHNNNNKCEINILTVNKDYNIISTQLLINLVKILLSLFLFNKYLTISLFSSLLK